MDTACLPEFDPHDCTVVVNAKPSYALSYLELDPKTFQSHGLICRRSPDGGYVSNVELLWRITAELSPQWADDSIATQQLALNALRPFLSDIPTSTLLNNGSLARQWASAFADDILASMPDSGGCVPYEEIESWCTRMQGFETEF